MEDFRQTLAFDFRWVAPGLAIPPSALDFSQAGISRFAQIFPLTPM
jgi:hypothetical protein